MKEEFEFTDTSNVSYTEYNILKEQVEQIQFELDEYKHKGTYFKDYQNYMIIFCILLFIIGFFVGKLSKKD